MKQLKQHYNIIIITIIINCNSIIIILQHLKPFHTTVLFLHSLKTQKKTSGMKYVNWRRLRYLRKWQKCSKEFRKERKQPPDLFYEKSVLKNVNTSGRVNNLAHNFFSLQIFISLFYNSVRFQSVRENEQTTLQLALLSFQSTSIIWFEIKRKKTGDETPYFPCDGTTIVLDDSTHSLKCVHSMQYGRSR